MGERSASSLSSVTQRAQVVSSFAQFERSLRQVSLDGHGWNGEQNKGPEAALAMEEDRGAKKATIRV